MNKKKILFLLTFFLLSFLIIPQKTLSAESSTISVQPSLIDDIYLNPGQSSDYKFTIKNKSGNDKNITLVVKAFTSGEEPGTPIFSDEQGNSIDSPIIDWISFEEEKFKIEKNKEKEVSFNILVPSEAAPGGYFAAIFAREEGANDPDHINIKSEIGTLLTMNVAGLDSDELNITKYSKRKSFLYPETLFIVEAENNTTNYLKPEVSIKILNILGKEIDSIELENKNFLPGDKRMWEREYSVPCMIAGIYKAELNISFNDISKTEAIYLFSISKTFYIVILVLLIVLLLMLLYKRRGNKTKIKT